MARLTQTRSPHENLAFLYLQASWDEVFQNKDLGFGRNVTDMEYEAFMDFTNNLPLIALFSDGKKAAFTNDAGSLRKMQRMSKKATIVEVKYLPDSFSKLGGLYKQACQILKRENCEVYDHYAGLANESPRPFTAVQEHALKWSTFHMVPPLTLTDPYHWARRHGSSEEDVRRMHSLGEAQRQESATTIISATFDPDSADTLRAKLLAPFISAAFERLYQAYKGQQPH